MLKGLLRDSSVLCKERGTCSHLTICELATVLK